VKLSDPPDLQTYGSLPEPQLGWHNHHYFPCDLGPTLKQYSLRASDNFRSMASRSRE